MVGFVHFSNFFIPSEKYYKLQVTPCIYPALGMLQAACAPAVHNGPPAVN